jgi:hypothetical protein
LIIANVGKSVVVAVEEEEEEEEEEVGVEAEAEAAEEFASALTVELTFCTTAEFSVSEAG